MVLRALSREEAGIQEVIVVDNASHDTTAQVARAHGATVLREERKGYGSACLKALAYMAAQRYDPQDIVVFMDADYADKASDIHSLTQPIVVGVCSFVVGSRHLGRKLGRVARGAMTLPQRLGNRMVTHLISWRYGISCTDLGPFRAIRYADLLSLGMADKDYGWTLEMQLKAILKKIGYREVPVSYRRRLGRSKISGTWRGTLLAGSKILRVLFAHLVKRRHLFFL